MPNGQDAKGVAALQTPVPRSLMAVNREPTCWKLPVTDTRDPWLRSQPYVREPVSWIFGTLGRRLPTGCRR